MSTYTITASASRHAVRIVRMVLATVSLLLGLFLQTATAHAAGGFTFEPIGGTYTVGDTLTVSVHENSGSDPTNAVALSFSYPTAQLQYVAGDSSDSAFTVAAIDVGTNGTVTYHRGSTMPLTGDQLVERAIFKVVGSGTAVLTFSSSSVAVSSQDNHTNVAPNRGNASYTINNGSPTPSPNPTPGPSPTPSPNPSPAPKPEPTPPTGSSRPTITVTPSSTNNDGSSDIAIPLSEGDSIQLDTPADIEPATIQPDGISKVEYYLNGKLVKTVTVAPYTYHLDTTRLLNGKYQLTTKTYYTNGETASTTQTLVVHNPFGWTQFRLEVQKYLLLIIVIILLLVAAVITFMIRRSLKGGGGDDIYPTYNDNFISPSTPEAPQQ